MAVLETLSTVASGIQVQYDQVLGPFVSKLSKKIASIPDELLGIIFEAAVRMEGHEGVKMAKSLSHVSRRFRNVALAHRNLWTTLRSNGSEEEWDTFLSRSGPNADLHVYIRTSTSRDRGGWNGFIDCCSQTAFRWKTLTITRLSPPPSPLTPSSGALYFYMQDSIHREADNLREKMKSDMEFVVNACNGGDRVNAWNFPRLVELDIQCKNSKVNFSWSSPNLQVLRYSGQLATPSAVFSAVTNFQYEIASSSVVDDLLKLVGSMPNLLDLQLSLAVEEASLGGFNHFSLSPLCPSVVSFRLLLPFYRIEASQNGDAFITALLHALRIPNVMHLSTFVRIDVHSGRSGLLNGLSCALLPVDVRGADPIIQPTSIDYKIDKRNDFEREDVLWTFPVPLERIPAVSCLTFSACARVIFTREGHAGEDGSKERCRLREIRFSGCKQMTIEDLRLTVQSLKEVGAWNTLERFGLDFCGLVKYGAALEIVGMGKLRYSK